MTLRERVLRLKPEPSSQVLTLLRQWGPVVMGAAIFAALVIYIVQQGSQLNLSITSISWELIIILMIVRFIPRVCNGLSLKLFARAFGVEIDLLDWFGLTIVTSAVNSSSPISPGVVARGAYLKARYNLPVMVFTSMLAANYIIVFFVTSLIVIFLLLINRMALGAAFLPLILFHAVLGLICVVVMLFPIRWPFGTGNRVFRLAAAGIDSWEILRRKPLLIFQQMLLALIIQLANGLQLYIALLAIRQPTNLWQTILIADMTSTVTVVKLTPGNIGIVEFLSGLFAKILLASSPAIIAASLLSRIVYLIPILGLGPLFSYLLTKRLANQNSLAVAEDVPPEG